MDDRLQRLSRRWDTVIKPACSCTRDDCNRVFEGLLCAYESPPRAYHNINHINDCLNLLDQVNDNHTITLEMAIWYHDAIYEPLSSTNEHDSAVLMAQDASKLGIDPAVISNARRLIMVTADHKKATKEDEQLIADIDCAVLASEPAKYDQYAQAIRFEYAQVTEKNYQMGRRSFLYGLLSQDHIFHTNWAHNRGYENRAQTNLKREVKHIESQVR